MGLNKSSGNMYSWIDYTWNTIKGICPHGCTYCYMHRFPQKEVRLDEKEFKTDLGTGNIIFIGSSCDMFAKGIPNGWIYDTLEYTRQFSNTYLYQSKNPERMLKYTSVMGPKTRIYTTIETNRWYKNIMKDSPPPVQRIMYMSMFPLYIDVYVTIEPIMDFDLYDMVRYIRECNPKQVNIGADSGNNNLPEPSKEKLLALIQELKKFTVIDQKRNLQRLLV